MDPLQTPFSCVRKRVPEGEDHLAVIGLFVVTAEQVGDGPDEGGEGLLGRGTLIRLRGAALTD